MSHYTGSVPDTRRRTPNWRTFAACRADPDAMFPDSNKDGIEAARGICRGCPVYTPCLRDAIESGEFQWGIRAGLTPEERRAVKKELTRRERAAEELAAPPDAVKPPQQKTYATLRSLFDGNTQRVIRGHLAWTGPPRQSFKGRVYTPKQIAFVVDRGRYPVGRTLSTCGVGTCVLPDHVADGDERDERDERQRTVKAAA